MMNKNLQKWLGYQFESSAYRTKAYISFERSMRNDLKKQVKEAGLLIEEFRNNHFEFSAVLLDPETNVKVYVCIPDVRFDPDKWVSHTLYRVGTGTSRDGVNRYCRWEDVGAMAKRLSEQCSGCEAA